MATVANAKLDLNVNSYRGQNWPMVIRFRPSWAMSDDMLLGFCSINSDLRVERKKSGEIVIMPPCGGEGSGRNAGLTAQLYTWAKKDGTGKAFDATCGFTLPDGAMLSPDSSWVSLANYKALTAKQRKKFLPLCPEFVVELRSESDRLKVVQTKMADWIKNGAKLGWLIDPLTRRVHVYRARKRPQILENPTVVSGEPLLPGFELDLRDIW